MSALDEIIHILADSPLAFYLRMNNCPKSLLVGKQELRYVVGPGDDKTLGFVCDQEMNSAPRYVPSSFLCGVAKERNVLETELGVLDILLGDRRDKGGGILISVHQRALTLPANVAYERIAAEDYLEQLNLLRKERGGPDRI